ncbi:STAS domain-containing protein [Paenibacillus sp. P25]|nr:STAS domain-containing protein [Paenibacillus sp. P25]
MKSARRSPFFHLPEVPFSLDMLLTVLPYSLALAVVGITESLLTATLVDELTETKSDKNREIRGQGIANVITGFFGGMAGCAMIGQTVINVKSGGRKRLSTFVAGAFLLFLILVLGSVVKQIPMSALVGVMFMVSIGTFDWNSLRTLNKIPRGDAVVMVVTVAVVVYTSNLAIGVVCGVVLSALNFGWNMAQLKVNTSVDGSGPKVYEISGQLFFGTMLHFIDLFEAHRDPQQVIIDFSRSHVWDQSAVNAIAKVLEKYEKLGKKVSIAGLNAESRKVIDRVGLTVTSTH